MSLLKAYWLAGVLSVAALLALAGCSSFIGGYDRHQAEMDAYCSTLAQENADPNDHSVETFFSWKIHTCVQVEVDKVAKYWRYNLVDVSHGFLRAQPIVRIDTDITLLDTLSDGVEIISGHWVPTQSTKGNQLPSDVEANIECDRGARMCRESDGEIFGGELYSSARDYRISLWDRHGIVADGYDDEQCGVNHRLIVNVEGRSVILSDYPKKITTDPNCNALQAAHTSVLKGGGIMAGYTTGEIFSCFQEGVSSAIIAKVNQFKGKVSDKDYDLWMDDGEGGRPARSAKPSRMFSQADCDRAMQKKIAELKGD
jgi:hypothetical protein